MLSFSLRLGKRNFHCGSVFRNYGKDVRGATVLENIRNVAIIAHVDHGKTTLVDCLLRQSGCLKDTAESETRVMDSNELEKERGITILAKATAIDVGNHRINIVDTPGHADFGGEVERALSMVDGVILVVDANEGPMAQTKFVLAKALARKLKPIVVFNKVDRPTANPEQVDSDLLDLFASLNATDEQMEYSILYASAKMGWAFDTNPLAEKKDVEIKGDMSVIYDAIIKEVPCPKLDLEEPFQFLVNSIEFNPFLGPCYLGRVHAGKVKVGEMVHSIGTDGKVVEVGRINKIFVRRGIEQLIVDEATAGDIVALAGLSKTKINYTIANPSIKEGLPYISIDPPTVSMSFLVNSSPISGQEGKAFTHQSLFDRLAREAELNPAFQVRDKINKAEGVEVKGRGELQLAILLETIRREGFEVAVSSPMVVFKKKVNDKLVEVSFADLESGEIDRNDLYEPMEEVIVDTDAEYCGAVIDKLSIRKGEMKNMIEYSGKTRLIFHIAARGLMGYATSDFKNDTHGTGVISHRFLEYVPYIGDFDPASASGGTGTGSTRKGSIISLNDGVITGFALRELEDRGTMFVHPGDKVYAGMIIGECNRDRDVEVNPTREKATSNIRMAFKEEHYRLQPPRMMTMEEMISVLQEDEIIEITPASLRMRKKLLNTNDRKIAKKKRKMLAQKVAGST